MALGRDVSNTLQVLITFAVILDGNQLHFFKGNDNSELIKYLEERV